MHFAKSFKIKSTSREFSNITYKLNIHQSRAFTFESKLIICRAYTYILLYIYNFFFFLFFFGELQSVEKNTHTPHTRVACGGVARQFHDYFIREPVHGVAREREYKTQPERESPDFLNMYRHRNLQASPRGVGSDCRRERRGLRREALANNPWYRYIT